MRWVKENEIWYLLDDNDGILGSAFWYRSYGGGYCWEAMLFKLSEGQPLWRSIAWNKTLWGAMSALNRYFSNE